MNILENKFMQNLIIATVFMFLLFITGMTLTVFKKYQYIGAGIEATNTISVTGEAEVLATPNIAVFTVSVNKEAQTAKEAKNKAAKAINDIISSLKSEGVEEKDIKTLNYNLYPQYEWKRDCNLSTYDYCDSKRVQTGYRVSQTIKVKVRDIQKAGDILSKVAELQVDNISSLSFEVENKKELERQARSEAIENAKKEAARLAKDLGVDLVRIVSFTEQSNQPIAFMARTKKLTAFDEVADAVIPELPTGESKIKSTVTLVFEIR